MALIDITGHRYGRLLVVRRNLEINRGYGSFWVCRCDCGRTTTRSSNQLRTGHTVSCGCYRREIKATLIHGMSESSEFRIWSGIKSRCLNKNRPAFPRYGGSGIKICERWASGEDGLNGFECFLKDMGMRPSPKHSIDRYPDIDGNYEPGNCRWATPLEQANNKRHTRRLIYRGQQMSVADAVRLAGSVVNVQTAANRVFRSGWSVDMAVETPSTIQRLPPAAEREVVRERSVA